MEEFDLSHCSIWSYFFTCSPFLYSPSAHKNTEATREISNG